MKTNFGSKYRTLTPEKAVGILARYGTHITIEKAKILLDFLYKISNLSVSQAIKRAKLSETQPSAKIKNRNKKQKL
jgi:hypothetical protein